MIDVSIFPVYGLIIVISLALFGMVFVLSTLIASMSSMNSERSHRYLTNIIISIFGGIIAVILIELKGHDFLSSSFYLIILPFTLLLILIFVLFGIWYLYVMDKMFNYVKDKKNSKKNE